MNVIVSGIHLMFGSVRFSLVQNFSPKNTLYLSNIKDEVKEGRHKYCLFFIEKLLRFINSNKGAAALVEEGRERDFSSSWFVF